MRLTHDPQLGGAYIRLREPSGPVETVCVSDELMIDMAPDGTIYGIELLNANEQFRADDGRLIRYHDPHAKPVWPPHPRPR